MRLNKRLPRRLPGRRIGSLEEAGQLGGKQVGMPPDSVEEAYSTRSDLRLRIL